MIIAAMKQALEFISSVKVHPSQIASRDSLHDALQAAIEAAEKQEPVDSVVIRDGLATLLRNRDIKSTDQRLYTTPPAAQPAPVQPLAWAEEIIADLNLRDAGRTTPPAL
jgi:hypothetical protein